MNSFRRALLSVAASLFFGRSARGGNVESASPVIDDLGAAPPMATIGTEWRLFTDTVMGGVSKATMTRETVAGRPAIRLRGDVSLENNGGFVQIALDFRPDGAALDAGAWRGIQLDVFGNDEDYALALRTADLTREAKAAT